MSHDLPEVSGYTLAVCFLTGLVTTLAVVGAVAVAREAVLYLRRNEMDLGARP